MGCMNGHIHLDKHIFGIFFLLKECHVVLYYLFFLILTVYIFIQINECKNTKIARVWPYAPEHAMQHIHRIIKCGNLCFSI
jgi:hypothetical protein